MADIIIAKRGSYDSSLGYEPVEAMNGTDKVEILVADDYSIMGIKVTESDGTEVIYEVAITVRT